MNDIVPYFHSSETMAQQKVNQIERYVDLRVRTPNVIFLKLKRGTQILLVLWAHFLSFLFRSNLMEGWMKVFEGVKADSIGGAFDRFREIVDATCQHFGWHDKCPLGCGPLLDLLGPFSLLQCASP